METISDPVILDKVIQKAVNSSSVVRPHIVIEDLNIHIHDNHVLQNINLTIPVKKFTCIIGPSGCG